MRFALGARWLPWALAATLAAALVAVGVAFGLRGPAAVLAPSTDGAEALTFLAVARQGYGDRDVRAVALGMEAVAAQRSVHGVFYLGDNFFPDGVRSVDDLAWRRRFERLYDGPFLSGTPFYAVPGNHDHQGNLQAEFDYARLRQGSGRWHMDGPLYARDFGRSGDRVLLRVVFLDTVAAQAGLAESIAYLRRAFAASGEPLWRAVMAHHPSRTLTAMGYKQRRTLAALLPVLAELDVDLYVSGDDWFQQILDRPGEPLHVSTNGGTRKLEPATAPAQPTDQVASTAGFGILSFDAQALTVELVDSAGQPTLRARRLRAGP